MDDWIISPYVAISIYAPPRMPVVDVKGSATKKCFIILSSDSCRGGEPEIQYTTSIPFVNRSKKNHEKSKFVESIWMTTWA